MGWEISIQVRIIAPETNEAIEQVISSLEGFSLNRSEFLEPGDLLIFEMGGNIREGLHFLHTASGSGRIGEIFLITPHLDPEVLIQARRAGADKIFVHPFKKEELRDALLQIGERQTPILSPRGKQKSGMMIYILGCKGGVGTTTVALNLAGSLAQLDKSRSVLLTDMTVLYGDLPVLLNINPSPNWGQVIKNISRINANHLKGILSGHPSGFYVLPSPSGLEGEELNPEVVGKMLSLMQKALDFLLIDGGKSTGEISARISEMADMVLLVTNLNHPCIENVKRLFPFFRKLRPSQEEKIRIVVNRYQKNSPISLEDAEKELGKHIFWNIPNDYSSVMEAAKQGKTLKGEGKEICRAFQKLAALLLTNASTQGDKNQPESRLSDKNRFAKLALSLPYKLKPS